MGIIRKLLIFASSNGLIVQAHGPVEHHKAVQIDYKSKHVSLCPHDEAADNRKGVHLEAHGLIGLLSIASSHFLIAITGREQVAQIFGKPIYVVTDVEFLPLSSRDAAVKALATASAASRKDHEPSSDSELSDAESESSKHAAVPDEVSGPHTDDEQDLPRSRSSTSIAQDVLTKKGNFGRFASQWFSRQGWATGTQKAPTSTDAKAQKVAEGDATEAAKPEQKPDKVDGPAPEPQQPSKTSREEVAAMIPKILRSAKLILTSRSCFFSYDFDLTRRMGLLQGKAVPPAKGSLDPLYFWNQRLASPISEAGQDSFVLPIIQGFVGQRSFAVKKTDSTDPDSACVVPTEGDPSQTEGISHAIAHAKEAVAEKPDEMQAFLLTVISRRSVKRAGLRYLRRGIDDEGNCANCVETEQILSTPEWDDTRPIRSFTQVRASIPLYFSQSPYSFKPLPVLLQSEAANKAAMKKHFDGLKSRYGDVQIAVLINKHGSEAAIGEAYDKNLKSLVDANEIQGVDWEWFDFHSECRGMRFDKVQKLVEMLGHNIEKFGETVIERGEVKSQQKGIIRTNCMDCLDRTNVAESAFGQHMLQKALAEAGFGIDLVNDETTTWFNTLWADNGDAISRQYAGTAALKGDFTRTRKRNYQGALNDFSLTLSRYYNNMVNDYFSQAVIDVLLGELSWTAFEDFESSLMSQDPGISINRIRENAIETCRRLVVQDETEDLIHGWTMLAPAVENTLRTLPFQEAVVLLTDAAIYCCKFDWTTEKVASFEKVDLRSVTKVRYGAYITSTFTERQRDETMNVGLVIAYKPGKGSVIRTNTRSLQNSVEPAKAKPEERIDGGTGVLSWLAPKHADPTQALAVKIIPVTPDRKRSVTSQTSTPALETAEHIVDEIRRAIAGESREEQDKVEVEQGDIISLAEAKQRTGYLEQIGYSLKRLVWA
ncbi:uncharacterized protein HMPREF1541_03616 [Cyphellophora europaea CBS 101466]|uniref:SAC domain-containing protein n=1 Tax=Cyphellophora europaea (strain CBS 101466) TaxID=1220924 RepID=W2RZC3_CYPE1|nr:uncharacterized protein HMPREF1541_03616 [Cyphellophora europaea CBS 101466]ETN41680.1 hypothetical protein HMPREF1541_03616 [Cyphellophora europaea CBS 101466]